MTTTNSLGQAHRHEEDPFSLNSAHLRVARVSFKRLASRREYAAIWRIFTRAGYSFTCIHSSIRNDVRTFCYGKSSQHRVLVVLPGIWDLAWLSELHDGSRSNR